MSKKILITGGVGFIGSHTLELLSGKGHECFSLDVNKSDLEIKGVKNVICDFNNWQELLTKFNEIKPEVVVHLGALPSVQTSIKDPVTSGHTNILGTLNVLEAAREAGAKRVIFASSAAVYGYTGEEYAGKPLNEDLPLKPKNPYGLAKKMGEELLEMWSRDNFWTGVDTVSLRFFNVFGPRQKRDSAYATAIERFLYQWQKKEPLTIVPPGTQRRDMIFVKDVARGIEAAALSQEKFNGRAINIGSGKNYSIFEIAEIIGGKGYATVMIEPRPGDVREVLADISRAKKLLNWQPEVSFEDGIEILKSSSVNL